MDYPVPDRGDAVARNESGRARRQKKLDGVGMREASAVGPFAPGDHDTVSVGD